MKIKNSRSSAQDQEWWGTKKKREKRRRQRESRKQYRDQGSLFINLHFYLLVYLIFVCS